MSYDTMDYMNLVIWYFLGGECLLKTATCQNPQVKLSYAGPCDRKKFDDAAKYDTEISIAAKHEHNGQETHVSNASGHLGTVTILTIGVVISIMFVGYQIRKRNFRRRAVNPMTFGE